MSTPRETKVQPTTPPSSVDAEAEAQAPTMRESSIELTSGSLGDYLRAWGKRIRSG